MIVLVRINTTRRQPVSASRTRSQAQLSTDYIPLRPQDVEDVRYLPDKLNEIFLPVILAGYFKRGDWGY